MPRMKPDPGREAEWRRHLERQRTSGLGVRAFCRQHGLVESSFHYWRRTIAERDRRAAVPEFVPVAVIDAAPADAVIDIRLTDGKRVRVRSGCDHTLLATVIAVLEGRPC